MNILLLMMGGVGSRFGADRPKQFVLFHNRPIFSYIAEGYDQVPQIDRMVIVSHASWMDYVQEWCQKLQLKTPYAVVAGGETRSESVLNGLRAAKAFAAEGDVVLLHDATHPYVDADGTCKVIDGVKQYGGATLATFQYDTTYQMDEETHLLELVTPRRKMVTGASPEAFLLGELLDIYEKTSPDDFEKLTSGGAIALANGITMQVIETHVLNLKITYKPDMELFEKLCDSYFFPNAKVFAAED